MSTQQNVMALLKQSKPSEVVDLDFVKEKFVTLHNQIHGNSTGENEYALQVFNYKKLLAENQALRDCSPLSLYGCFLDLCAQGLSLEQGTNPDCYITSRNFNVGTKDVPAWEKRAVLGVSPYGELKLRMRAGHVKFVDNPVIVYEGDIFKLKTTTAGKTVEHESVFPRKSNKIIAAFARIIRNDGSVDFSVLTEDDITRLAGFSERQNKGKTNALYSSNGGQIDTGFLKAKVIKHAFKTYPKVKTGYFTQVEETETEVNVDYGFDPNSATVEDISHQEVDDFGSALEKAKTEFRPETVTVEAVSDDDIEF